MNVFQLLSILILSVRVESIIDRSQRRYKNIIFFYICSRQKHNVSYRTDSESLSLVFDRIGERSCQVKKVSENSPVCGPRSPKRTRPRCIHFATRLCDTKSRKRPSDRDRSRTNAHKPASADDELAIKCRRTKSFSRLPTRSRDQSS